LSPGEAAVLPAVLVARVLLPTAGEVGEAAACLLAFLMASAMCLLPEGEASGALAAGEGSMVREAGPRRRCFSRGVRRSREAMAE